MDKLQSLRIENKEGQSIDIMINGEWVNPKDIVSMDIHIEPNRCTVKTVKQNYFKM